MTPNERLREIMVLIDSTISLTDDPKELILLSYAMAHRSKELLDRAIGPEQRRMLMRELAK
jgi:hypothetical protein